MNTNPDRKDSAQPAVPASDVHTTATIAKEPIDKAAEEIPAEIPAGPAKPVQQATTPPRGIARLTDRLEIFRKFLTNVVISGLLLLLIVTVIREVTQNTEVLEPIDVPRELIDRGYSPTVVAQRLNDEIGSLARTGSEYFPSGTKDKDVLSSKFVASAERPDIEVPGGGFSVRALVRYARYVINRPEAQIEGSISKEGEQLQLVLRTKRAGIDSVAIHKANNLEELLSLGAQNLLKERRPLLLAGYFLKNPGRDPGFKKTEEALRGSVAKHDVEGYDMLGLVLQKLNRHAEAIGVYQAAANVHPKEVAFRNNWGNALSELGRHEEAIEQYQKAAEIKPTLAIPYRNWCNELNELNNPTLAIEKCQKAIELQPDYANAYNDWGDALTALKRYSEASTKYQTAIQYHERAGTYVSWGFSLVRSGDYAGGIEKYQKAIKLDPKNAEAYFWLGAAYQDWEKFDQAVEQYKKAIELKSDYADAYQGLGDTFLKMGKQHLARENHEKARNLRGN